MTCHLTCCMTTTHLEAHLVLAASGTGQGLCRLHGCHDWPFMLCGMLCVCMWCSRMHSIEAAAAGCSIVAGLQPSAHLMRHLGLLTWQPFRGTHFELVRVCVADSYLLRRLSPCPSLQRTLKVPLCDLTVAAARLHALAARTLGFSVRFNLWQLSACMYLQRTLEVLV